MNRAPAPPPLRWGVLGVSEMVGRLAVLPALRASPTAELMAIASRDLPRARAEAARFGARDAYGSYERLLASPEIEAVYIPLPNALHREWTERAAAAGKHVLCEKPLACTAAEAEQMAAACAASGVTLMEAYMTPFHPRSTRVLQLVRDRALGQLRFGHAAFTFPAADPLNHRWRPELGGGSLLDVGIYCLAPLLEAAGQWPTQVRGHAVRSPGGVDASFAGWLACGGFAASFQTSFEAPERQRLELVGTEAVLTLERPFTPGLADSEILLTHRDGRGEVITTPTNDPYRAMVEHFAAVVRGRAVPRRPVATSVSLIALLDRLRASAESNAAGGSPSPPPLRIG